MLSETTKGVISIVTTPFDENDRLDLDAIGPMMEFYRSAGCDGVTLLGVMGEAPKMSSSETQALLAEAIANAGDMTVLVGLGAMGVAQFSELTGKLVEQGAHGVMVNAPGNLKTDADGVNYFTNIGRSIGDIPFVLQDFPLATGVHLPVGSLEQVIENCPNLKMIKLEDWPGWAKLSHLSKRFDAGEIRRVSILSGFGALYFPEDLQVGSDGALTGFSFPEMLRSMLDAKIAGQIDRMYDIHDAFLPIVRAEMSLTTGLAVRKHILHRRGVLPTPKIRFPGSQLSPEAQAMIDRLLDRLEKRCSEIGFELSLYEAAA